MKVIQDDDIIADGEHEKLDHLDVVLKQQVRLFSTPSSTVERYKISGQI